MYYYNPEDIEEIYNETDSKETRKDIFYDGVMGDFPLTRDIKAIVEGDLTHPGGPGTLLDVEESAQTKAWEFADEEVFPPVDTLSEDTREQFLEERKDFVEYINNKYYDKLSEKVEDVYRKCVSMYVEDDSKSFPKMLEEIEDRPTVDGVNTMLEKIMS